MEEKKISIYALSDIHLPGPQKRSQEQFGQVWIDHLNVIKHNVLRKISPDDILLIPGDISWSLDINRMNDDFEYLNSLNCQIVLTKGNHDKWASKESIINSKLPQNCKWVEKKCLFLYNKVAIVATRLWDYPGIFPWPGHFKANNAPKNIEKKLIKNLTDVLELLPKDDNFIKILLVHFPPISFDGSPGIFSNIIDSYKVDFCIYGHVHNHQGEKPPASDITIGKTKYLLTSCDWLKMDPLLITTI